MFIWFGKERDKDNKGKSFFDFMIELLIELLFEEEVKVNLENSKKEVEEKVVVEVKILEIDI